MDAPDEHLRQRVADLLHKRPVAWRRATGGYTPAERWVVTLDDNSTCFVKTGVSDWTSNALRAEYERIYSRIEAPFLARVLGWHDDNETPLLILEDLSPARWPPPWTAAQIESVIATIGNIRRTKLVGLPRLEEDPICRDWWRQIEEEPGAFLSLGLVSQSWLRGSLAALQGASAAAPFTGDELVHFDLRSDNICFHDERVIVVDWNNACHGNGDANAATWLPSLQSEGGPPPETILPGAGKLAAWMSGYWAWNAGLPGPERLRNVQLRQLRSALPWAVRALDLPPLDGPNAPHP